MDREGQLKSVDAENESQLMTVSTKKQEDEYYKVLDKKEAKYPQDAVIFGKPSVLLNKQELKDGTYLNKSLNEFTAQQLVELAEKYNSGSNGQSSVMKDIFDQLEQSKKESEYERTEIEDRTYMFTNQAHK